jgi:hypothetical protein
MDSIIPVCDIGTLMTSLIESCLLHSKSMQLFRFVLLGQMVLFSSQRLRPTRRVDSKLRFQNSQNVSYMVLIHETAYRCSFTEHMAL